jgi:hypothetical protein
MRALRHGEAGQLGGSTRTVRKIFRRPGRDFSSSEFPSPEDLPIAVESLGHAAIRHRFPTRVIDKSEQSFPSAVPNTVAKRVVFRIVQSVCCAMDCARDISDRNPSCGSAERMGISCCESGVDDLHVAAAQPQPDVERAHLAGAGSDTRGHGDRTALPRPPPARCSPGSGNARTHRPATDTAIRGRARPHHRLRPGLGASGRTLTRHRNGPTEHSRYPSRRASQDRPLGRRRPSPHYRTR